MERPIGDIFDFDGVKLEVVKEKYCSCERCYFHEEKIPCIRQRIITAVGRCNAFNRKDLEFVIFKKIE